MYKSSDQARASRSRTEGTQESSISTCGSELAAWKDSSPSMMSPRLPRRFSLSADDRDLWDSGILLCIRCCTVLNSSMLCSSWRCFSPSGGILWWTRAESNCLARDLVLEGQRGRRHQAQARTIPTLLILAL